METSSLGTKSYTLGIDLGTTHSVVAVWKGGRPEVLPIQNGAPRELLKSVIFVENGGKVHVGEDAWNRRLLDTDRFVASVKSHMGTDKTYTIDGETYTPERISSLILKEIVERARAVLERSGPAEIRNLVVTVPARFSPKARKATEDAVRMAGYEPGPLSEPRTHVLLLESDAAALAYLRTNAVKQKVLVYDMGGGTFDVSVMEFDSSADERIRPLGPAGGDPRLGGDVFDQMLLERLVEHFNCGKSKPEQRTYPTYLDFAGDAPAGVDRPAWNRARHDLLRVAREIKLALCEDTRDPDLPYETVLPELWDKIQPEPFLMTQKDFEALIAEHLEAAERQVMSLLAECKVDAGDIDRVILAGGSTRIPAIARNLHKLFGKPPYNTLEPDKAIAIGAAIYGELDFVFQPKQYLTVPVGVKVTRVVRESIIGDIGRDREERDQFQEVLPRGVEHGDARTLEVTTIRDRQKTMRFQVYQQETGLGSGSCNPEDCIGWVDLTLPDGAMQPKGVPRVVLTFTLNANGTEVAITAAEQRTGTQVAAQFQVAGHGVPLPEDKEGTGTADIVIAMDTTGSMGPHIDSMKRMTRDFVTKVGESGVDYRLALIDYRDLKFEERLTVHPFTADIEEYQRRVSSMSPDGGHDEPESALDALERALELSFRAEADRILILITDASTHDPSENGTSASQVAERVKQAGASLFVIAPDGLRTLYGTMIEQAGAGRFYDMGQPFDDILDGVAADIRDISVV